MTRYPKEVRALSARNMCTRDYNGPNGTHNIVGGLEQSSQLGTYPKRPRFQETDRSWNRQQRKTHCCL